jgi:hypothetical protein
VLQAVAFATSTEGMAVGSDSSAVFTRSGGLTWSLKKTGIPTDFVLTDVAVRSGPLAPEYWAVGNPKLQGTSLVAKVFRTTDNGASWHELIPALPAGSGVTLTSLAFASANEGFVVGSMAGRPIAFHLTQPDNPVWTDVSPLADAAQPRGLRSVCCGLVQGSTMTFAVGETGVLLQWNGTQFVGVPDIYEFDPDTGAILVNRYHQDFTVAAIAPGVGRLYVGRDTTPEHAFSQESGYVLLFDSLGWREVRVRTNKDLRGISFVSAGPDVTALVLGNSSVVNATLDDGLFSDTVVLVHAVQ